MFDSVAIVGREAPMCGAIGSTAERPATAREHPGMRWSWGGVALVVSAVGTLAVRLVVSAVLVAVHRYLGMDTTIGSGRKKRQTGRHDNTTGENR